MTTVSDLGSCRVGVAIKRPPASVSPDEAYDNHEAVSRLVREALHQGGLGKKEPQVPLADIISPGMHVLLKPNWVHHVNSTRRGMACMVTHPQFILAVLSEVLKAKPGRVIVGDAPIQGCDWNALIPTAFQEEAKALAASHDVALDFVDFRRVVVPTGDPADGILVRAERSEDRQVHFDLKSDSALEPVSTPPEGSAASAIARTPLPRRTTPAPISTCYAARHSRRMSCSRSRNSRRIAGPD